MTNSGDTIASTAAIRFLHKVLDDHDEGRFRTLAEYQELFPAHRELVAAEYEAILNIDTAVLEQDPLIHAAKGDRYRDARTIGHGGMGTVLQVFDPALHRDVAMKRLAGPGGEVPSAELLGRFLDEAIVTGQLHHPGIVTVLEIGRDRERRPYFTMPLIEGRSLHEVIEDVHAGRGDWSQLRTLDALVRVCEAVAYAHERGVVHRDLKPANVMIGRFGETYVVDWGLARAKDRPDRRDIRICTDEDPAHPDTSDDSPLRTQEGDVIGTPAYMAPEQARGELDAVDTASDTYSLGAMLYHLLCHTPPFLGADEQISGRETLKRVLAGPPRAVMACAPTTAPELAAICERAMARDPGDRYSSAAALAADLRAFLETRVVHAYATGVFAKLRKWVRRNKGLAVASLVAIASLIGGTAWSEFQRATASANATLAAENLSLAFDAGDELLGEFGLSGFPSAAGSDPLRRLLTEKALKYTERLRDLRGDDPRVENQVARALFRIAQLNAELGLGETARIAWQEARTATEKQIANTGPSDVLRRRLIKIRLEQDIQRMQAGDVRGAIPGLEFAAEELQELRQAHPDSSVLTGELCRVFQHLSLAMTDLRNKEGALRYSAAAVETSHQFATQTNNAVAANSRVGSALMQRGQLFWTLDLLDEAAACYEESARALEAGLAESPSDRTLRSHLGRLLNLQGNLEQQLDQNEGEDKFTRSAAIYRELVAMHPGVRDYHGSLGGLLCNLGAMRGREGDHAATLEFLEEAQGQIQLALEIDPEALDYQEFRRSVARNLVLVHLEMNDHRQVATVARDLVREVPNGSHTLAATFFAACVETCGTDTRLSERERGTLAQSYGGESMALLHIARARGKLTLTELQAPDYQAIRSREDFQALTASLQR